VSTAPSPEERRRANRAKHHQDRQERHAARGPRGVAAAWWDHARATATQREREGDSEAWNDLTRTLENFCNRYA
jgi:hypothetical protein